MFRRRLGGALTLIVFGLALPSAVFAAGPERFETTFTYTLDDAIADYQKADEAIPEFVESKRRVATLLEVQGQVDRARTLAAPPARPESLTAARNERNEGVKISSRARGVSVLPVVETRTENRT